MSCAVRIPNLDAMMESYYVTMEIDWSVCVIVLRYDVDHRRRTAGVAYSALIHCDDAAQPSNEALS